MKAKIIFSIIFLFCYKGLMFGQCYNEVSTNYLAPTNNALPDNTIVVPNGNLFLNNFNWFPVSSQGFYSGYDPANMIYQGVTIGYLMNIMDSQSSPTYYDYIYNGPLPLHENGWELLLLNLGRFPNGDEITSAQGKSPGLPYIVIYNKYTGVIRVFFAYGLDGTGADAVDIELSFSDKNKMSGLLRLSEGRDVSLDKPSKVRLTKSIAKDPNLSYKWMSTDFQIAYDPCTCYYPSELELKFTKIYSQSIKLVGGSTSLPNQDLVNNQNIVNPTQFLANINYTNDNFKNGAVIYKSMQSMIDDYIKKYDDYNKSLVAINEHNTKVKTNLAVLKVAKTIGVLIATGVSLNGTPLLIQDGEIPMAAVQDYAYLESISAESADYQAMFQGLDGYSSTSINMDFFKVAVKSYGEIMKKAGTIDIMKVMDIASKIFGEKMENFVNQNFKTKDLPTKPSMPTATFTEYKFDGVITNEDDTYGPKFYNPGTFKNEQLTPPPPTTVTSPYKYPIYNEVLGTFAMLVQPKLKFSQTVKNDSLTWEYNEPSPYNAEGLTAYQTWTNSYQFKLEEPLNYYFNPSLDIKEKKVRVAFLIKATRIYIDPQLPSQYILPIKSCYLDPFFNKNVTSNNANQEKYDPVFSKRVYINSPVTSTLPALIDKNEIEFITPYFDVDALQGVVGGIGIKNEFLFDHTPFFDIQSFNLSQFGYKFVFNVQMKVLIDVEFNSTNNDGFNNQMTQVLTYDIPSQPSLFQSNDIVSNLENTGVDYTKFSENLVFLNTNFNGQNITGCILSGTTYTCQAWKDVKIDGVLNVSPGYNVNIFGGTEVIVTDESIVNPEIILAINPILDYSQPMPMVSSSFVKDFCKGKLGNNAPAYLAGTMEKTSSEGIEEITFIEDKVYSTDLSFMLFPNPANTLATVQLSRETPGAKVQIYDLMGRENEVTIRQNDLSFELELTSLVAGVYLVKVSSIEGTITKTLIVK